MYKNYMYSACAVLRVCVCRSKTLKEEVKTLKEKEAKETKALEDMVQKVEENLVTATVSQDYQYSKY